MEINKYQDVVLVTLNSLMGIQKDLSEKENIVLPTENWVNAAKEEMKSVLKEGFHGKIPPWIAKMVHFFERMYRSEMASKLR